jgi:8-oxo-dGTP pyrophosphatase MutT (NUDIX family)
MIVSDKIRLTWSSRFVSMVSRAFEHNGKKGEWTYATRRSLITTAEQNSHGIVATDYRVGDDVRAVIIVAMVNDPGRHPDYVMNKEFRVPLVGKRPSCKCWEISFPAGLIDNGESPEDAAIRELAEETPYMVDSIVEVSPPLASSSGITDEMVHIVRCWAKMKPDGATKREASEDIETFLAKDTSDPRIPQGEDIVWSVRAWLELDDAFRGNSGVYAPVG